MEDFREYIDINESAAVDLFVAYRFLRILTTAWEDQEAFKHGIIDKDGKLLRKANTLTKSEEKASFTMLHRLVFNLKRILHKIPGVKTKIGTYATALFLLKQHFPTAENEKSLELVFKNWLVDNGLCDDEELFEDVQQQQVLPKGKYTLKEGGTVVVFQDTQRIDEVLGYSIFPVLHQKKKKEVYVSLEDLKNV